MRTARDELEVFGVQNNCWKLLTTEEEHKL